MACIAKPWHHVSHGSQDDSGKPGKPENNLQFYSLRCKIISLAFSVYIRLHNDSNSKLLITKLLFVLFVQQYSTRNFNFREKIAWNFRKIWLGKPGNDLDFRLFEALGTMQRKPLVFCLPRCYPDCTANHIITENKIPV